MRTGMARDTKKDWQEREEKKKVPLSREPVSFSDPPPRHRLDLDSFSVCLLLIGCFFLFFFCFFSWLHSTGSRFV